jgi:hypothetical protein
LMRVLQDGLQSELPGLSQAVVEAVHQFTGTTTLTDDFCLITLEAIAPSPVVTPPSSSGPPPGIEPRP